MPAAFVVPSSLGSGVLVHPRAGLFVRHEVERNFPGKILCFKSWVVKVVVGMRVSKRAKCHRITRVMLCESTRHALTNNTTGDCV